MTRIVSDLPLIVGVRASAGCIDALTHLFENVPAQKGMAFVIMTHLNPDRERLLHTVLDQRTGMKVVAEDDERVEAGTVYVMPERVVLLIKNGRRQRMDSAQGSREHKPIDIFFRSLAEDQRGNVLVIVLSGGDGDGTLGVKIIKEQGGVTFAHTAVSDPPLNPEMPQSAIAKGFVDFAIPAA